MFLRSFNFTLKNGFFQHQYQKQEKMFVLRQYFFGVMRNKLHWTTASETSNTKYLELIKRRSKVQEKNMSCERALNFDQWKTFSENYKPMRVWLWLVYKFTENCQIYRLFPELIQTKKRYPPSLDKIRILTLWNYLSSQAKIFLVNLTLKEFAPCKISHICRCVFKQHLHLSNIWSSMNEKAKQHRLSWTKHFL